MPKFALLIAALLLIGAAPAHARGLSVGFYDPVHTGNGGDEGLWFARASEVGADIIRVRSQWAVIAPKRPANPADPADPVYRWKQLDGAVRAADAAGLEVAIGVHRAPAWAEGPDRPRGASPGTWRPDVEAFAAFATALARRYSGATAGVPRVRFFQPWNEPNLARYLTPQWEQRGGALQPASPTIYRSLLNAFYASVRSVQSDAVIVSAGTSPFGDPRGGSRMYPLYFARELMCLDERLRSAGCVGGQASFDAIDHHPYSVRGPFSPALNDDDITVADLHKLVEVVRAAERRRTVVPARRKAIWATELSWDSAPSDPEGVPAQQHAEWLQQSLYQLWRQGASTAMWFLIGDQRPVPSLAATYQSGVLLEDGRPKRAAQAFRFPFVAVQVRDAIRLWGLPPRAGTVVIEQRRAGRWVRVRRVRSRARDAFLLRARLSPRSRLRARVGEVRSMVTRPVTRSGAPAAR